MSTRLEDTLRIVQDAKDRLAGQGIALIGVMIDHDSLMKLNGEAKDTEYMVEDAKYRTRRMRLAGVSVTAGTGTRQAP